MAREKPILVVCPVQARCDGSVIKSTAAMCQKCATSIARKNKPMKLKGEHTGYTTVAERKSHLAKGSS